MNRNVLIGTVFAALIVSVIALVYLNIKVGRDPESTHVAVTSDSATAEVAAGEQADAVSSPTAAAQDAPGATGSDTLLLYFQGADVGLLFPEERSAPSGTDGSSKARQVLMELAKGPTKDLLPTIPPGTEIREVYFDSTGVAYVDFSAELRDNHPGGSAEELLTVDSIVNSIARNVAQVQAVQFLVEGRAVVTLAGHVNLTVPLLPSSDRIAQVP